MTLHVMRGALKVSDEEIAQCMDLVRASGEVVFNPDKKRLQCALPECNAVVQRAMRALGERGFTRGRLFGGAHCLHSLPMCARQMWHTDYDMEAVRRARRPPMSVVVALQDGTRLLTLDGAQTLGCGDILVFGGDVVHAGAEYAKENTRIHIYLDVIDCDRPANVTWLLKP